MKRFFSLFILVIFTGYFHANAQQALEIPVRGYGIAIGDSEYTSGIRLNFRDAHMREVNGLNLNVWYPRDNNFSGTVNGLTLGVPAAGAREMYGLGFGGVALVATGPVSGIFASGLLQVGGDFMGIGASGIAQVFESAQGIMVSGLAGITSESFYGIQMSGLAGIAAGNFGGIAAGGLVFISGESKRGITAGGLANISGEESRGIHVGGLATISGETSSGIHVGGLAVIAGDHLTGLSLSGLSILSGEGVRGMAVTPGFLITGGMNTGMTWSTIHISEFSSGISFGAIANIADRLEGVNFGGLMLIGGRLNGINVTGGAMVAERAGIFSFNSAAVAERLTGFNMSGVFSYITPEGSQAGMTLAPVNWNDGRQQGLSIGLINYSRQLNGVQLGLLNIAGNKSGFGRVLPFINF